MRKSFLILLHGCGHYNCKARRWRRGSSAKRLFEEEFGVLEEVADSGVIRAVVVTSNPAVAVDKDQLVAVGHPFLAAAAQFKTFLC